MAIERSRSAEVSVSGSGVFRVRERSTIATLVSLRCRLPTDGGHLDTQSEKGMEACGRFLAALERTAGALRLEAASREYRQLFAANYRSLFDGESRSYRVDILEAGISLNQHPVIWANGEEYELSDDALLRAELLRSTFAAVCAQLGRGAGGVEAGAWAAECGSPRLPPGFDVARLESRLIELDVAWAGFECSYIGELMKVQVHARRLVEQAVDCERCLSELEQSFSKEELMDMPDYQTEKRALVACVARLNSVANFQRKGRDDLPVGILDAAVELLDGEAAASAAAAASGSEAAPPQPRLGAARCIAEQVVQAFEELRDYLHEIQHHLDLLHPHLCQNKSLVARLIRWEEAWEIGARYVHHEEVLKALCFLVPQLQRAQQIVPALQDMCTDCDAELFLILPRLVSLCLLAEPARAIELLRRLLPHRFHQRLVSVVAGGGRGLHRSNSNPDLAGAHEGSRMQRQPCLGPELQALMEKFWRAELLLTRAGTSDGASAWDVLIRRAISGSAAGAGAGAEPWHASLLGGPRVAAAVAATEDLMHDLEGWSMELQRHSPEDWNECSSVLLQCLARSAS